MEEHGLNEQGQARRRFLKQAGTVAWASPLIVTMMSRSAYANHEAGHCGSIDVDPSVCIVTQPCGSTEQCLPDPLDPGECACVAT